MGHPGGEHRWAIEVIPGPDISQQVEARSMRRIQQRRPRRGYECKEGRSKGCGVLDNKWRMCGRKGWSPLSFCRRPLVQLQGSVTGVNEGTWREEGAQAMMGGGAGCSSECSEPSVSSPNSIPLCLSGHVFCIIKSVILTSYVPWPTLISTVYVLLALLSFFFFYSIQFYLISPMPLRSIHISAWVSGLFVPTAEWYSIVRRYHRVFWVF